MAKESWYINESELDDFQVRIVQKKLRSSFVTKGCAGSGKTVLALWRAKELSESGEDNYLIIVFTKALKQFIEDGIRVIGIDSSRVMYYWEWNNKKQPNANHIIVDEVQDFDTDELKSLQNAAREHLILFGDSAQQLYADMKSKGTLLSMEGIATFTGLEMESLVINHRLTKKIARVAEYISSNNDNLELRCSKEGIHKPMLVKTLTFSEQLDYIIDVVKAQNLTDVGILFTTNKKVQEARDYFSKKKWFIEAKIGYGANCMDLNFHTENPKLMTFHSAKGLQFEAVFIPDCSDNIDFNRNALYVAITRSYSFLFLLYSNNLSRYLSKVADDLFKHENLLEEFIDDLPF